MKVHHLAEYFPLIEGEEFDMFVEDIKTRGQREPIVMVGDEILDGVNRWRACERLGIEPKTVQYDGDDPLDHVISLNVRRRHLDVSQRAALATEMLPEFERQARERKESIRDPQTGQYRPSGSKDHDGDQLARDDAARMFGVSGPSVQRAKRIKAEAPEKFKDIIKGKTTVTAADIELRRAKEDERKAKAPKLSEIEITAEQMDYITTLERIVNLLPRKPPVNWGEDAFQRARGYALIIRKRLEVFENGQS